MKNHCTVVWVMRKLNNTTHRIDCEIYKKKKKTDSSLINA